MYLPIHMQVPWPLHSPLSITPNPNPPFEIEKRKASSHHHLINFVRLLGMHTSFSAKKIQYNSLSPLVFPSPSPLPYPNFLPPPPFSPPYPIANHHITIMISRMTTRYFNFCNFIFNFQFFSRREKIMIKKNTPPFPQVNANLVSCE